MKRFFSSPHFSLSLATLIWWLAVFFFANYAAIRLGTDRTGDIIRTHGSSFLMPFFNFDAGWYWGILTEGYGTALGARLAFYPLFPLFVQGIHLVTGLNVLTTGYLFNLFCTLIAVNFLYRLAEDFFQKDSQKSLLTVQVFLFFPLAFFLSAFYSEALFCALTFASFYYARKRSWWIVGILLGFLTAARLPGIIVVVAVFLEYLASVSYRPNKKMTAFLCAPLGFLSYGFFLKAQTGNFWNMFRAYSTDQWAYQHFNPNIFTTVYYEIRLLLATVYHHQSGWQLTTVNILIPVAFWLGAVAITIIGWKKLSVAYRFFLVASLLAFVLNSNLVSVNRYIFPLFPLYLIIVSSLEKRPLFLGMWLGISGMAGGVFLFLFANGFWVA